jgi:hypothetical protein
VNNFFLKGFERAPGSNNQIIIGHRMLPEWLYRDFLPAKGQWAGESWPLKQRAPDGCKTGGTGLVSKPNEVS